MKGLNKGPGVRNQRGSAGWGGLMGAHIQVPFPRWSQPDMRLSVLSVHMASKEAEGGALCVPGDFSALFSSNRNLDFEQGWGEEGEYSFGCHFFKRHGEARAVCVDD